MLLLFSQEKQLSDSTSRRKDLIISLLAWQQWLKSCGKLLTLRPKELMEQEIKNLTVMKKPLKSLQMIWERCSYLRHGLEIIGADLTRILMADWTGKRQRSWQCNIMSFKAGKIDTQKQDSDNSLTSLTLIMISFLPKKKHSSYLLRLWEVNEKSNPTQPNLNKPEYLFLNNILN